MIFQGAANISFFKMLYQGKGYSFLEMIAMSHFFFLIHDTQWL
jgi:hypothetical protein